MLPDWTGQLKGELHVHGIEIRELAKEAGYHKNYVSQVLHEENPSEKSKERLERALENLIMRRDKMEEKKMWSVGNKVICTKRGKNHSKAGEIVKISRFSKKQFLVKFSKDGSLSWLYSNEIGDAPEENAES